MAQYTVAAKTGTAQKSNTQGYLPNTYYSSVIGFFPADTPQIVIAVALDEPQNGYYGGMAVAPVFRSIAEQIAECLAIPPDKDLGGPARSLQTQPTRPVTQTAHLPREEPFRRTSAAKQSLSSMSRP
jgi:hypothetical protein